MVLRYSWHHISRIIVLNKVSKDALKFTGSRHFFKLSRDLRDLKREDAVTKQRDAIENDWGSKYGNTTGVRWKDARNHKTRCYSQIRRNRRHNSQIWIRRTSGIRSERAAEHMLTWPGTCTCQTVWRVCVGKAERRPVVWGKERCPLPLIIQLDWMIQSLVLMTCHQYQRLDQV